MLDFLPKILLINLMMEKFKAYVPDTSALQLETDLMYRIGESLIVIPTAVIKELDGLKYSSRELVARAARKVARTLDRIGNYGDVVYGVRFSIGGILHIYSGYEVIDDLYSDADNRIVGAAIKIKEELRCTVTLVTTDTNMRHIARTYWLKTELYPFYMKDEDLLKIGILKKEIEEFTEPTLQKSQKVDKKAWPLLYILLFILLTRQLFRETDSQ